MIKSQRIRVRGIPYPHTKNTGNVKGCTEWTDKIVEKTANLKKVSLRRLLAQAYRYQAVMFSSRGKTLDEIAAEAVSQVPTSGACCA